MKNWGALDITVLVSDLIGFQNALHAIRLQLVEPFERAKKTTM